MSAAFSPSKTKRDTFKLTLRILLRELVSLIIGHMRQLSLASSQNESIAAVLMNSDAK